MFYFGGDAYRSDWYYRGEGELVFSQAHFGTVDEDLISIRVNPKDTGPGGNGIPYGAMIASYEQVAPWQVGRYVEITGRPPAGTLWSCECGTTISGSSSPQFLGVSEGLVAVYGPCPVPCSNPARD